MKREGLELAPEGFRSLVDDAEKLISPSLVVPDAGACRTEIAAVPGVGEDCVAMLEAAAEFTRSELFVALGLLAALLLGLEDEVEFDDDAEADSVVLVAEFEASLLRDDPDDERDCEVTSDELADEDCELDPEEAASASFCTFCGGSNTDETTIVNSILMHSNSSMSLKDPNR